MWQKISENWKPLVAALGVVCGGITVLCTDVTTGAGAMLYFKDGMAILAGIGGIVHIWEQH